jgi:hypothetical protein
VATSVAYTALLTVREETVLFLSDLLNNERRRRGTRTGRRSLTCFKQAVLVLRWFLDGTRLAQLAADNTLGPVDRLPVPPRRHRRPQQPPTITALSPAGSQDGRPYPHQPRRHADPHRPVRHPRPHPRGGPMMVGKTSPPRRQHPGHLQPRRMTTMDLAGTPRPRTRLHLPQSSPRHPASVDRVDR